MLRQKQMPGDLLRQWAVLAGSIRLDWNNYSGMKCPKIVDGEGTSSIEISSGKQKRAILILIKWGNKSTEQGQQCSFK